MGKTLQEQTIKDNFLFAAIMLDSDICKEVLERILEVEIDHVEVVSEKSIVFHPEYHGIRLDVYAKENDGTYFNVEMQVERKPVLKRARYYHSNMDVELLRTGIDYELLPDSYVIFICDYDPIGLGKYKYTKYSTFREDMSYNYKDGIHTYFLSTKGKNVDEVPGKLVKFLDYVGTGKMDETDDLLDHLKRTEVKIKSDREIGERFMVFEEMMQDQFKAGKAEGVAEATAKIITAYLNNGGTKEEAVKIFEMTVDEIEQVLK